MCGRFAAFTPPETFAKLFHSTNLVAFDQRPRYNIAPGQNILAAKVAGNGERVLTTMHWGLIPVWAKEKKTGYSMINARAETVAEKPAFKRAFRQRRCLIAADGFYEWQRIGKEKQPYFFHLKNGEPFAFAGIWEHWEGGGESIDSCAIIVTTANTILAPVHDRMPVIVPAEQYDFWLNPDVETSEQLRELLLPYPPEKMEGFAVDRRVNTPVFDSAEALRRQEEAISV